MTTITLKADFSDLDDLKTRLKAAGPAAQETVSRELPRIGDQVADAARATVATYDKKSTGELLDDIQVTRAKKSVRIHADDRQAELLERGTPNTGPPRPWLSEPAQVGADELYDVIVRAAVPL